MSSDVIRSFIVAQLNTIPDIGIVHSYQRYAARTKQMGDLYTWNGQLRGWYVRRIAQKETYSAVVRIDEDSKWLIRGYMAVDDAAQSELVFDGLIDQVLAVFRIDTALADPNSLPDPFATLVENKTGASLETSQPVIFCDALCHSATLTLTARKRRIA